MGKYTESISHDNRLGPQWQITPQDLASEQGILIWGRVQSREYTKKVSETECEKRVAYEVSVSKLECADHAES